MRRAERLDGDDAMKKLFLILIASFALVMIQGFSRVSADGGDAIPLSKLAGKYASTGQGTITLCFKPDFSALENCSTMGAATAPGNFVLVGQSTEDKEGNTCSTATTTFGFLGSPSLGSEPYDHTVTKVTNYDPATGSGDLSGTHYTGGKCSGSKFDSAGATVAATFTQHFVASDNGERLDSVVTTLTNSVGYFGAFNLTGIDLKQK
jgi:hypothetical protein